MKKTRSRTKYLLTERLPDPGRKLVYDALHKIIDQYKQKNGGMLPYGFYRDILDKYGSRHKFLNLKSIGKNYARYLKKKKAALLRQKQLMVSYIMSKHLWP